MVRPHPDLPIPRKTAYTDDMAFEKFTRSSGRKATDTRPILTINRDGKFSLNIAAFDELGRPDAVQLLFDRDVPAVGLLPSDRGNPSSYVVVNAAKDNYSKTVSAGAFCNTYNIDHEETQRYVLSVGENAEQDGDGIGQADLNKPL
jgi:hypothetical protein